MWEYLFTVCWGFFSPLFLLFCFSSGFFFFESFRRTDYGRLRKSGDLGSFSSCSCWKVLGFFVCFLPTPLHTSGSHYVLWGLLLWKTAGGPVALVASQPCKSWGAWLGRGQSSMWRGTVEIQMGSSGTWERSGCNLKDSQMDELDWRLFPPTPLLWRTSVLRACSKGQSLSCLCWPLVHIPLHN